MELQGPCKKAVKMQMSLCFSIENTISLTEISLLRKESHVLLWANLLGQQEEKAVQGHTHLQHQLMLCSLVQNTARLHPGGPTLLLDPKHPNSVGRVLEGSAVRAGLAGGHVCPSENSILGQHRTKNWSGQNLDRETRRCLNMAGVPASGQTRT